MSDTLFETAPDFDQPIAVLKHCHDRIRKQLRTLHNLSAVTDTIADAGNPEARQAAASVLRYFDQAAPLHHEDEEHDLLPMLQASATGNDATTLMELMPGILQEHQQMDAAWQALKPPLQAIAAGADATLKASDVQAFADTYDAHMEREETHIASMAKRIFSPDQMLHLGQAMRRRRGIVAPGV